MISRLILSLLFVILLTISCTKNTTELKRGIFEGKLRSISISGNGYDEKYYFFYDSATDQLTHIIKNDTTLFLSVEIITNNLIRLHYDRISPTTGNTLLKYNVYHANNRITAINTYDTLGDYSFEYNTIRFSLKDNTLDSFYQYGVSGSLFLHTYLYDFSKNNDTVYYQRKLSGGLVPSSYDEYFFQDTIITGNILNTQVLPFQQLHSQEGLLDPFYILGIMGYDAYTPLEHLIRKKNSHPFSYELNTKNQVIFMNFMNTDYRLTYY